MGLFGSNSVIGLDLGSSSIKAVKLEAARGRWRVVTTAVAATPAGAIVEGAVANATALRPALRQLIGDAELYGGTVAAIGFTSAVSVHRAAVAAITPEALRRQIRLQPDQFGLNGGPEWVHDFELGAAADGGREAFFVSASREQVEGRAAALEAAGLELLAMDVEPLALMRALVEADPAQRSRSGATAILDLGAGHSDVTIVRSGEYVFTRAIPFGGNGLSEAIRQALECEAASAEEIKKQINLRWLLDTSAQTDDTTALRAATAMRPLLDEILREVRNSLLYYHAQLPDEDTEGAVTQILLAGGTAQFTGLPVYVQETLRLPATVAECRQTDAAPALNGSLLPQGAGPLFSLALGLALKEPMASR